MEAIESKEQRDSTNKNKLTLELSQYYALDYAKEERIKSLYATRSIVHVKNGLVKICN